MGGMCALEAVVEAFTELYGPGTAELAVDATHHMNFTFANRQQDSSVSSLVFSRYFEARKTLPASRIKISLAVFDKDSPVLLGLDLIGALGIVPDVNNRTVYASTLGRFLPIVRLPTGHLAWDLRPTRREREVQELWWPRPDAAVE